LALIPFVCFKQRGKLSQTYRGQILKSEVVSVHDRHVRIHHQLDVNADNPALPFLMAIELKRTDIPLLNKSKVRDLHVACLSVDERRGDQDALFGRLLQYTLSTGPKGDFSKAMLSGCWYTETHAAVKISRLSKIAGIGLIGFCAASIAADKANLGPTLSQAAGFAGAFLDSLVAGRRSNRVSTAHDSHATAEPMQKSDFDSK
jgi:hypothetical protein